MIALSIRQPWAYLILTRGKDVENRSWPCPAKHLGTTILLHAGVAKPSIDTTIYGSLDLLFGGIVGMVQIVGCVSDSLSDWAIPTMFHWLLANARSLQFHPCKGQLGFFEVDYPHPLEVQHGYFRP